MLFNYKNISLHILSQVTKLMQRTHFKIYLWLFCICRKVNHKTKLKTFLRAGWHNWLFSHKALSIYYIYGERERNALGFKRNIRILSFLSETRDRDRERLVCGNSSISEPHRSFAGPPGSEWKKLTGRSFKHKTAVSSLSEADERLI